MIFSVSNLYAGLAQASQNVTAIWLRLFYSMLPIMIIALFFTHITIKSLYNLYVLVFNVQPIYILEPSPPQVKSKGIQKIINELEQLDFTYLVAIKTRYPLISTTYSRIYVSKDSEIVAQVSTSVLTAFRFLSCYPDNATVITRMPFGTTIETSNLVSRFIRNSVEKALTHHQKVIEEWDEVRGKPLPIQNTADVFKVLEVYAQSHAKDETKFLRSYWILISISMVLVLLPIYGIILISFTMQSTEILRDLQSIYNLSLFLAFFIVIVGFVILESQKKDITKGR